MSNSDFISPAQHEQEEVLFDSGGTCDCYRLVKDNRVYCVKRPKKDMCSSEVYMHLFRKEFELGIELEHPNIVRYLAYDEDDQGNECNCLNYTHSPSDVIPANRHSLVSHWAE